MEMQELIKQTIENLKTALDTEKVVGKPILAADGSVILPVSKLSFGFVAGGGEYGECRGKGENYPAATATGAGVTVTPLGFLVCGREKKFISVDKTTESKWSELARAAIEALKDCKDDD